MDVIKHYTYYEDVNVRNVLKSGVSVDSRSKNWVEWVTTITRGTCVTCFSRYGKIFSVEDAEMIAPPVHTNCRCQLKWLTAFMAGTVTEDGVAGVDFYVYRYGCLPDYYLTSTEAKQQGWNRWQGNLREVIPGAIVGGDIYKNRNGKLPNAPGRVWYEADFDYDGGYRNLKRIVFSNDGLMFVTYDHYFTFSEVYLIGDIYELYT